MKLLNISTTVQLLSSQTPRKPAVRSLPRLDDETGWKGGLDCRQGEVEGDIDSFRFETMLQDIRIV